ncbi:MAG: AAA family ATPase, partial [Elusimicrobiota bacterium]|nr:AAA family ATPase [Elusimicrobiota bacterium]
MNNKKSKTNKGKQGNKVVKSRVIKKIVLKNFKRFEKFEVDFDDKINILIGDNESGKSTILQAIDIVLSGSAYKVENIGLENLFNHKAVDDFMNSGDRKYEELPKLLIELYLGEQDDENMNGKNNTKNELCDGLKLICEADDRFSKEVTEILKTQKSIFPFEYYFIRFETFSGEAYKGHREYLKHIVVDNSAMSSEYSMKEYVKNIYNAKLQVTEKLTNQYKYRKLKKIVKNIIFKSLNDRLSEDNYCFALKTSPKSNLETDLTIFENDISIDNKGKGRQCLIKTEMALQGSQGDLDIVLIEEPENHLSHINMQKLINGILKAEDRQIFIATHSDLISSRLDLRKTILLNSSGIKSLQLKDIEEDTARFFMKAPNNNILQFILSKKVILVEGPSEYILMEAMYKKIAGEELSKSDVHIIAVGGIIFKRYLDLAKILNIKTAVITDND